MLNIVNKQIKHTVFGEGKVISQSESKLSIEFSEKYGTKGFVYPDAFEKYLKLADDKAQASVMDDLHRKEMHTALDKMEQQRQHEDAEQKKADEKKLEAQKKRAPRKTKAVKEAEEAAKAAEAAVL